VQCTEALTNVFYGAVKLLKDFEGGTDRSWKESFEITRKKYSESTINEFIGIHSALDALVTETTLGVALAILDRAPSADDIRVVMRDEMANIVEEIQWQKEMMQAILDSPAFKDLPLREHVFRPDAVIIDETRVLGCGASMVYAGKLQEQTNVAVEVVKVVNGKPCQKLRRKSAVRIFRITAT
jgi:hypothetical protein